MSHYFKDYKKGFSLIELIVSLGVVLTILSVIVFNQSKYLDSAALSNLAQELGSNVFQTQAYGIAVKELTPGSSNFSTAYGVAVSILSSGSPANYLLYADRNANKFYDGSWVCNTGGTSECLEKVELDRGNFIDSICAVRVSGADQCSNIGRVDISFVRPNTEAELTFFNTSGQLYIPPNLKGVKIILKSPAGLTRSVTVYTSGQVSVE